MTKEDVSNLRTDRGHLKKRLTTIEKFVDESSGKLPSRTELEDRLQRLDEISSQISELQAKILEQDDASNEASNLRETLDVSERIETLRSRLIMQLKAIKPEEPEKLEETTPPTMDERILRLLEAQTALIEKMSISTHDSELVKILLQQTQILTNSAPMRNQPKKGAGKLPALQFKSFDGKTEEYIGFREIFDAVIAGHDLSEAHKYGYLTQSLSGEPLKLISSLENQENSYTVARELLDKRYYQKRLLVNNHMRALFNVEAMDRDTSQSLRLLISETQKHVRYLQVQDINVVENSSMLIHLISAKLHHSTRGKLEEKLSVSEIPTWDEFIKILESRAEVLEATEQAKNTRLPLTTIKLENLNKPKTSFANVAANEQPSMKDSKESSKSSTGASSSKTNFKKETTNVKPRSCSFCKQAHLTHRCLQYLQMTPEMRLEKVQSLQLCKNCLKTNHKSSECKSSHCLKCEEKHHTSIHDAKSSNTLVAMTANTSNNFKAASSVNSSLHTLLATVSLLVRKPNGSAKCRALLDSCAQSNFVTESFVKALKLPTNTLKIKIQGIGGAHFIANRGIELEFKSLDSTFRTKLLFIVLPHITENLPSSEIEMGNVQIPANMKLADPEFNIPGKINMLIGAELFYDVILPNQKFLSPNLPTFYETKFGYIAAGKFADANYHEQISEIALTTTLEKLSYQIEQFWNIENMPTVTTTFTKEEQNCEDFFTNTTTRDQNGTFVVRLPKKSPVSSLGKSFNKALACLKSLERRFDKDNELRKHYTEFMREYLALGHMREISLTTTADSNVYYIPHLPVIRPDSVTTKMRTVFNASAKTSTGLSLNDILMVGPTIQCELWELLVRFRIHRIVFTADIQKMYRCIKIHENDYNLQRILWRENENQPLQAFQLTTVSYGTAPASFLATRCLKQLAAEENVKYPNAVKVIDDFYMDDVMSGAHSIAQVILIQKELAQMLNSAGFNLHKWASNHRAIIDAVEETMTNSSKPIQTDDSVKTLGLLWNTLEDYFHFAVNLEEVAPKTKRTILSEISRLFDPLGLVSPVIVTAKILMQHLWTRNLSWDEIVPNDIIDRWQNYRNSLHAFQDFGIPRWLQYDPSQQFELHGFCDASEIAYGAVIYLRTNDHKSNHHCRLVCSKSRVAPLKKLTTPRAELQSALLLKELVEKTIKAIKVQPSQVRLWSDSTIALSWIATEAVKLKPYCNARVEKIQELKTNYSWHHVAGTENPADLVSRGTTPEKLFANSLWWKGPTWLHQKNEFESFQLPSKPSDQYFEELRPSVSLLSTQSQKFELFDRYSLVNRLVRIVAICRRYISNLKLVIDAKKKSKYCIPILPLNKVNITAKEFDNALMTCVKLVQAECFENELKDLLKNSQVHKNSTIAALMPFTDKDGLIRARGRLLHSELYPSAKQPIILPHKHKFTIALAREQHLKNHHAGPSLLLNILRERFWPLRGRQLCRKVVKSCLACFRAHPQPIIQRIGNLPSLRVTPARPFLNTGIDYAGPVYIKSGTTKKAPKVKAYIAVFVCLATKAAHIELVQALSTVAFLAALKRFIARRGKPATLHSDNGRNFVGANNELEEFFEFLSEEDTQNKISKVLASDNIEWKFIPPYSPHRGGIWEALVKSVKHHLVRSIQTKILTFEELSTFLCDVEAILNSRPLIAPTENITDPVALTPGDFLICQSLTSSPTSNVSTIPMSLRTRWKAIKELQLQFWNSWLKDYLPTLQSVRNQWRGKPVDIKLNDLVIIQADNMPPGQWPLGRVTALHRSQDNVVRTIDVKTSKSTVTRAVQKVCLIPPDGFDE